ncbi:MAG: hypothetical protein L3J47_00120 [Sulfurovum sp.]|nr:hypothetical protein [Sulfurovum sp.]
MGQAIEVKYISPTDIKGVRFKATCQAGSIVIDDPSTSIHCAGYEEAARALCRKLGWPYSYISGQLKNGNYAFVSAKGQK